MNIRQIENNVKAIVANCNEDNFIYDFLLAYGLPKATIKRQQLSAQNQSALFFSNDVSFKKKVYFRIDKENELPLVISELANENGQAIKSTHPRFVIATDFKRFMAIDTKTKDSLDTAFAELPTHYAFFLPWAGMEKSTVQIENPADVKAAERMAKLFDEIKRDNPDFTLEYVHGLNVFLTRLLFCFFAEDTEIFPKGAFTQAIDSYTQNDGSDLADFLTRLFSVLNTPEKLRSKDLPDFLQQFPYVNGGLFRDAMPLPMFSVRSRNAIVKSGELDWAAINPDIFGSMIQNVVTAEDRGDLGIHYTSVPNIMKVIQPLFLDELYKEFTEACILRTDVKNPEKAKRERLEALLNRIAEIRCFDPACGSGNFLIIAYRELRKLEIAILEKLDERNLFSRIELKNFYGIEISDFACEVAKLSLWLAEHQMNMIFKQTFGQCNPTLPLQEAGQIICGNATRLDWAAVCPKDGQETYVLGNPPYVGSRKQNEAQKEDLKHVFNVEYKTLDYICAWFYLAANYIRGYNAKAAFVSTNSLSQGELVSLTWPRILRDGIEIGFAHKDFKWQNNAKFNAAVIVIVVGLQNVTRNTKLLIDNERIRHVESITPYLTEGRIVYIYSRTNSISNMPAIKFGNMPADNGLLLFSTEDEKNDFLQKEPQADKYIYKLVGAVELINRTNRFCLWLDGIEKDEIKKLPLVYQKVNNVREIRLNSSRPQLAETPHLFAQITQRPGKTFIAIPKTSSERRRYIPMDFLDETTVSTTEVFTITENATPCLFGILTSWMHMCWVKAIGGRLKTDYRYSKDIVYNNFPFPRISERQREELSELAQNVLYQREMHSEKTLAELYDPEKMPEELKEAHHQLDLAVERCYRSKPFESDEERLEHLFNLYERMIAAEGR
ncbi:MAG: class I SAM-dependent DNA methyltransferase [Lentisphaeria bacterium]|nr:class I SAM-dependent DNA methyltransferase [Lentisphaeria bacterium]